MTSQFESSQEGQAVAGDRHRHAPAADYPLSGGAHGRHKGREAPVRRSRRLEDEAARQGMKGGGRAATSRQGLPLQPLQQCSENLTGYLSRGARGAKKAAGWWHMRKFADRRRSVTQRVCRLGRQCDAVPADSSQCGERWIRVFILGIMPQCEAISTAPAGPQKPNNGELPQSARLSVAALRSLPALSGAVSPKLMPPRLQYGTCSPTVVSAVFLHPSRSLFVVRLWSAGAQDNWLPLGVH